MESCGVCGGEGRIQNSFGSEATCPSCHGSGRRSDDGGMRDVTKTKPSHHRGANKAEAEAKATWPSTGAGAALAKDIQASNSVSNETKAKLIREILDHEAVHPECTQTFVKKMRKQVRPAPLLAMPFTSRGRPRGASPRRRPQVNRIAVIGLT